MKPVSLTILIMISFGSMLFMFDRYGQSTGSTDGSESWIQLLEPVGQLNDNLSVSDFLRASGKIEGKTKSIEMRFRLTEQIKDLLVEEGSMVSAGDILVSLESESVEQECALAKAQLDLAKAKKLRIKNGPRQSEIEAAKQEYEANLPVLWSAQRALARGSKLFEQKAINQQEVDDLKANVEAISARTEAAKARLKTLELPARLDELAAADADIQSAQAQLKLAQIKLERTVLRAPSSGRVLRVNAEPGELTGPDSLQPVVVMADVSELHALVEVDEFDALKVKLGQSCEVTSDAKQGVLATGVIVEIEPQMQPKRMYGQWAGETE